MIFEKQKQFWSMEKNATNNIYTFCRREESFLNPAILVEIGLPVAIIVNIYIVYFQYLYVLLICTIFLGAYVMTYPSNCKYLYYRWLVFNYNKNTTLSIDMAQKTFTYKHEEDLITFTSSDVERWSWCEYRKWNTTYVKVVRFKLKSKKTINISSGIGDIDVFLQENWKALGLPKGIYRYDDDFDSLSAYIAKIK